MAICPRNEGSSFDQTHKCHGSCMSHKRSPCCNEIPLNYQPGGWATASHLHLQPRGSKARVHTSALTLQLYNNSSSPILSIHALAGYQVIGPLPKTVGHFWAGVVSVLNTALTYKHTCYWQLSDSKYKGTFTRFWDNLRARQSSPLRNFSFRLLSMPPTETKLSRVRELRSTIA